MASYDTFIARCPDCGAQMEFQSKARTGWGGEFEYFALEPVVVENSTAEVTVGVPDWLAGDLVGDELTCQPCGRRVKLDDSLQPQRMLNRGRKVDSE